MKKSKKSGFTLVELMVVAAIIAILAAIIIPMLTKNKEVAVAADGKNIAGAVMNAAKAYYAREGAPFPSYAQVAADDTELASDVTASQWSVDALDGPTPTTITVSITDKNGYAGTVKFDGTDWIDTLAPVN